MCTLPIDVTTPVGWGPCTAFPDLLPLIHLPNCLLFPHKHTGVLLSTGEFWLEPRSPTQGTGTVSLNQLIYKFHHTLHHRLIRSSTPDFTTQKLTRHPPWCGGQGPWDQVSCARYRRHDTELTNWFLSMIHSASFTLHSDVIAPKNYLAPSRGPHKGQVPLPLSQPLFHFIHP